MVKVVNGPHRGFDLSQLTLDHLFEIAGRHESEFQLGLKAAILEELHRRDAEASQQLRHRAKGGLPPSEATPPQADAEADALAGIRPTLKRLVKKWYRTLTLEFHPDRRLDKGEPMAAINRAHELLQETFGV